ncbi:hypothetical protein QWA_18197 [Alcaligenes faecalis subsp. faecalis NCIB 8687]|nr:hypothetical protein QWA_18197 [Alcaligenes faecalis subsp. faecalis NCIB 8687]
MLLRHLNYFLAVAQYQSFTSLHYTSHPQPWVSGLEADKPLSVTGPSAAWDLGPDGECGYLEFQRAGIDAVDKASAMVALPATTETLRYKGRACPLAGLNR